MLIDVILLNKTKANPAKYSFYKYSKKYKLLFSKERYKLKTILPNAKIEHIGSSAVEGLGGKGIIDIVIAVPKNRIKNTTNKLKAKKYDLRPNGNNNDRLFFQKIIKYKNKERRVHLHLTSNNSKTWNSLIAVRNYLRENKKIAEKYAKLKKKAVVFAKGIGKKYRDYKDAFIKKIEKLALKNKKKRKELLLS